MSSEVKRYVASHLYAEGTADGFRVVRATDYAALEAENARLIGLIADLVSADHDRRIQAERAVIALISNRGN